MNKTWKLHLYLNYKSLVHSRIIVSFKLARYHSKTSNSASKFLRFSLSLIFLNSIYRPYSKMAAFILLFC